MKHPRVSPVLGDGLALRAPADAEGFRSPHGVVVSVEVPPRDEYCE